MVTCGVSDLDTNLRTPIRMGGWVRIEPWMTDTTASARSCLLSGQQFFPETLGGVEEPVRERRQNVSGSGRLARVCCEIIGYFTNGRDIGTAAEMIAETDELGELETHVDRGLPPIRCISEHANIVKAAVRSNGRAEGASLDIPQDVKLG